MPTPFTSGLSISLDRFQYSINLRPSLDLPPEFGRPMGEGGCGTDPRLVRVV